MKSIQDKKIGKADFKIGRRLIFFCISACLFLLSSLAGYKIYASQYGNENIQQVNAQVEVTKEIRPPQSLEVSNPVASNKLQDTHAEVIVSSVGDCTIGRDDKYSFSQSLPDVLLKNNNDLGYIFKNVADIFKSDNITTANLETTFTDANKNANKTFTFKGPASYAKAFPLGGIEGVNISNNHIYDYLQEGFRDTLTALKAQNVHYFGEGHKWITEVTGVKFGFLGYMGYTYDNNFLTKLEKDIKDLKSEVQFVAINFHWGIENKYLPNDIQKYLAHYAIDHGADLVVGHHPHVIQGLEKYKGKIIAYSLGNFAFGGNKNPKDKDTFILQVKLNFTNNALTAYGVRAIPCSISSVDYINDYRPTPLSGKKKEAVLSKINRLSSNLGFTLKDKFTEIGIEK